MWWIAVVALADPRVRGNATAAEDNVVPPPNVEVVPQFLEGSVQLVFAGREGDTVHVDGWAAGALPLVTQLVEGPHRFRIDGKAGRHEVEILVTVVEGQVPVVDLAAAPPLLPPPPAIQPGAPAK